MSNAEPTSGMRGRWNTADDRDPAEIERDLDATRADLRATLEALERRLSVDRLVEMTVGRVKERGGQFAGNLGEAIAENPMAIVLASVGLGWMMIDRRRGSGRRYGSESMDSATGAMSAASSAVGSTVGAMSDRVHDAMSSSRETMADAMETSRETMARARDSMYRARDSVSDAAAKARESIEHAHVSLDRMLEEQPLVLGAVGLAAGALIGALLPASETENRWLGEARETAVRSAAEVAKERVRSMQAGEEGADDDSLEEDVEASEQSARSGSERGAGRSAGQTH
jgi:ElaB/YqjD/DUF883 family membrane-anchored ribosome-binding protein